MIEAREFVGAALEHGYERYSGVPCSFLTPFINYVIEAESADYLVAANEGDAVAIAAGSWIGGQRAVAMMQNSGLGNAVSPLTSLCYTFRIPVLVVCTQRGAPGVRDEPQHELMGRITEQMFETMQIRWRAFPDEPDDIEPVLEQAADWMADRREPVALVMQKGTCAPYPLGERERSEWAPRAVVGGAGHGRPAAERVRRGAVLERVLEAIDPAHTVVIATTGFTGRELYGLSDRPNHLYMVGSMGCASSLGLGLARARPDLDVVVLDGDGAAMMRMGNLATIGAVRPPNFHHLLLDNEVHESTGGQGTVSAHTDFAAVAAACGYRRVVRSDEPGDLALVLGRGGGPSFAHVKIRPGTGGELPRPSITPPEVVDRLRAHIGAGT